PPASSSGGGFSLRLFPRSENPPSWGKIPLRRKQWRRLQPPTLPTERKPSLLGRIALRRKQGTEAEASATLWKSPLLRYGFRPRRRRETCLRIRKKQTG